MIYPERIKQARLLSGLTQGQLASTIGVGQGTIAHYETGRTVPSSPVVFAIAFATGVVPEFLERTPAPPLPKGSFAYRARASVKSMERDAAIQCLSLLVEQTRQMSASLNLPRLRFPKPLSDPLQSARLTRVAFGIKPLRPVAHLINIIERHGGIVFGLPLTLARIDAFSTWANIDTARPVLALSAVTAGDRLRYSTAHEVGHLVMHRGVSDYPADLEKEANLFAAEFLFPEQALRESLSKPLTLELAFRLKMQWGVSIQMIVRRARDIGVLSEWRYRQMFQQIGARGWRNNEPGEITPERPRLYRQAAETIYGQEYISRMGKDYGVGETLARTLLEQYDASYKTPTTPCKTP